MKKIGIFGGTFNPIHNGHLYMANLAKEKFLLEKIIFVPAGIAPHKTYCDNKKHRIKMLNKAIINESFEVSTFETDKETVSYTYETMQHFSKQYKGCELFFIAGGDSLDYMDKWKNPEIIFEICTVLVFDRHGTDNIKEKAGELEKKYNAKIVITEAEKVNISSSQIREIIKNGQDAAAFLSKPVYEYIKDNSLYKGGC